MTFNLGASATQLWNGCILTTIAHAIFTAHHPELANEQSWDGINYNIQDSEGALGTVTFSPKGTIGAFFDAHSPRNPFSSGEQGYDLSARIAEMPPELKVIAEEETLQYLLQDYNGQETSLITAVFWSEDGNLVAAEPANEVFSNGAHLIQTQLKETDEAIEVWRGHYGLTPEQVELLRSLFASKAAAPNSNLVLDDAQRKALAQEGSEGLDQSRDLLAGIGIVVP
jgi:hypothetical protein